MYGGTRVSQCADVVCDRDVAGPFRHCLCLQAARLGVQQTSRVLLFVVDREPTLCSKDAVYDLSGLPLFNFEEEACARAVLLYAQFV